jgi:mono/diheme cytochrome c family protein
MRGFIWGVIVGILLVPAVGAVLLLLGVFPISATANPPNWESSFARKAFAASVARQAGKTQNPIPVTDASLSAGLRIYREGCSGCHGDAGRPSNWGTHDFYPRVPQFDSDPPAMSDSQIFWTVKHGVRYTGMGAWQGLTSDDNIWEVAAFLSHLKNLPPSVEAQWRGSQPRN